jgi:hypothetical protein
VRQQRQKIVYSIALTEAGKSLCQSETGKAWSVRDQNNPSPSKKLKYTGEGERHMSIFSLFQLV